LEHLVDAPAFDAEHFGHGVLIGPRPAVVFETEEPAERDAEPRGKRRQLTICGDLVEPPKLVGGELPLSVARVLAHDRTSSR
jgi:hypothetical protein